MLFYVPRSSQKTLLVGVGRTLANTVTMVYTQERSTIIYNRETVMVEFKTPEFEDWLKAHGRVQKLLFPDISFDQKTLRAAFSAVDLSFKMTFSQPAHMDYDYPLRGSEFVRSMRGARADEQCATIAYAVALCNSQDTVAQNTGEEILTMILAYGVTGELPKTAKEVYGEPR
ncbi:MAG: hypothetical protein A3I44_05505 [Candidatus Sungbacteria bacterium RIFCSPLOWO2_02_FULL_51_17]|uniref:Uncharacterized protein n=1 Tax=Candidatus Sungbacteria bacterium RIFCSPHIGHO2_02_FULL_51_29 TaxID=1802273 RepID=A0A1G2KRB6_9BACT|nr:MAG: hypothetical protein A3C16_02385 [Candidatus Sungbacteria bacterium RIFCSPHIGHO2_02_FULL_51_29]OHA05082.1 MAG: hypothetical protein A3B29_00370 [Candidatus Sungbacteria bacterium RIFCSPLOWO2_01_FULL_51_34]OHA11151.1 MAG: hypothetical protein A3I44_05505 [Candidatus Sungbacteria bacterium RIFCSPLOWO2_02_FULL_51_17]